MINKNKYKILFKILLFSTFSVKSGNDSNHASSCGSEVVHIAVPGSNNDLRDLALKISLDIAYPEFKQKLETAQIKYHEIVPLEKREQAELIDKIDNLESQIKPLFLRQKEILVDIVQISMVFHGHHTSDEFKNFIKNLHFASFKAMCFSKSTKEKIDSSITVYSFSSWAPDHHTFNLDAFNLSNIVTLDNIDSVLYAISKIILNVDLKNPFPNTLKMLIEEYRIIEDKIISLKRIIEDKIISLKNLISTNSDSAELLIEGYLLQAYRSFKKALDDYKDRARASYLNHASSCGSGVVHIAVPGS